MFFAKKTKRRIKNKKKRGRSVTLNNSTGFPAKDYHHITVSPTIEKVTVSKNYYRVPFYYTGGREELGPLSNVTRPMAKPVRLMYLSVSDI